MRLAQASLRSERNDPVLSSQGDAKTESPEAPEVS